MTVQIQPAKPKGDHNGLTEEIEEFILANPHESVTVITTYGVKKITEDVETGDRYPVLKAKHIEVLTGDRLTAGVELQREQFTKRTGAEELDLDFEGGDDE